MSNKEKSIHYFEETYHNQNEQYSAQPMLNNWSDNKGIKTTKFVQRSIGR